MGSAGTINLVVGVIVVGILFYLGEENTTLVLLAIIGVGFLVFGGAKKVGFA